MGCVEIKIMEEFNKDKNIRVLMISASSLNKNISFGD